MNKDRIFRIGTSSECEISVPSGIPENSVWVQLLVSDQGMHQLTVLERGIVCKVNDPVVMKQYWVNEQDIIEIDGYRMNWDYIRGNSNEPFVRNKGPKRKLIISVLSSIVLIALVIAALLLLGKKPVPVPAVPELYSEACARMASDSRELNISGFELLECLAIDSLYVPAVLKYFDLVLTNKDTERWPRAFAGMRSIAEKCTEAAYECAMCLSYISPKLDLPEVQRYSFVIEKNYEEANRYFESVVSNDKNGFKAPFWQLVNLISLYDGKSLSEEDRLMMRTLYKLLDQNLSASSDESVGAYRKETDRIIYTILKNWLIID